MAYEGIGPGAVGALDVDEAIRARNRAREEAEAEDAARERGQMRLERERRGVSSRVESAFGNVPRAKDPAADAAAYEAGLPSSGQPGPWAPEYGGYAPPPAEPAFDTSAEDYAAALTAPDPAPQARGGSSTAGGMGVGRVNYDEPFFGGHYFPERLDATPEWQEIQRAYDAGDIDFDEATKRRNALFDQDKKAREGLSGRVLQYGRDETAAKHRLMGIESGFHEGEAGRQAEYGQAVTGARQDYEDRVRQGEESRQAIQQQTAQRMAQQDQAIENLSKMKVDPERGYGGVGGKIGAAIAVALGAAGAALTKTPNFAMQIVTGIIDRDIAAQRASIEHAKDTVAARQSMLGELRYQLGDIDAAERAYRIWTMDSVAMQADAFGAASKGEAAKAAAAELSQKALDEKDLNEQASRINAMQQAQADDLARRQAFAWSQQQAAKRAQAEAMLRGGYGEMDAKLAKNVIWAPGGGAIGIAPSDLSEKAKGELAASLAQTYTDSQTIDRLAQLAEQLGAGIIGYSEGASEFKQLFQTLRAPMKKDIAGAAENAVEKTAIDQIIIGDGGGASGAVMGRALPALLRTKANQRRKMDNELSARGVQRADVRAVPNLEKPGSYNYYYSPGQSAGKRGAALTPGPATK